MKKKFTYLCAMAGALCMFTACSDDDKLPGESLETKTYTEADGLTMNLDGEAVTGQVVTFTPNADSKGSISIAGAPLDISAIMGGMTPAAYDAATQPVMAFPTSSVIPGSATVTFPVNLVGDADNCTFAGTSATDYCTFAYDGNVTNETMTLNISDVKLKNISLVGTYKLPDVYVPSEWFEGEFELAPFNVVRAIWNAEKGLPMSPDYEMPASSLLGVVFAMPVIDVGTEADVTIPEALYNVLKTVTFCEDGNITAEYVDVENLTGTAVKSPKGLARYVVVDDNTIRVFLDPAAIIRATMANESKSSRALDINSLIEGLMTNVVPMLANGVPVHYGQAYTDVVGTVNENEAVRSFYLGTETLLPILKLAVPVLQDEETVNSIVESIAKDDEASAQMLRGMLASLPDIINTTTTLEIGINLEKTTK